MTLLADTLVLLLIDWSDLYRDVWIIFWIFGFVIYQLFGVTNSLRLLFFFLHNWLCFPINILTLSLKFSCLGHEIVFLCDSLELFLISNFYHFNLWLQELDFVIFLVEWQLARLSDSFKGGFVFLTELFLLSRAIFIAIMFEILTRWLTNLYLIEHGNIRDLIVRVPSLDWDVNIRNLLFRRLYVLLWVYWYGQLFSLLFKWKHTTVLDDAIGLNLPVLLQDCWRVIFLPYSIW